VCGEEWLHARALCGCKDRCEVLAVHGGCERCLLITESPKTPGHYRYLIWVHGGGNGEHEVKQSRRCRAPITTTRPGLRWGVPPQWSWTMKEDKGVVVAKGSTGGLGMGRGEW